MELLGAPAKLHFHDLFMNLDPLTCLQLQDLLIQLQTKGINISLSGEDSKRYFRLKLKGESKEMEDIDVIKVKLLLSKDMSKKEKKKIYDFILSQASVMQ